MQRLFGYPQNLVVAQDCVDLPDDLRGICLEFLCSGQRLPLPVSLAPSLRIGGAKQCRISTPDGRMIIRAALGRGFTGPQRLPDFVGETWCR